MEKGDFGVSGADRIGYEKARFENRLQAEGISKDMRGLAASGLGPDSGIGGITGKHPREIASPSRRTLGLGLTRAGAMIRKPVYLDYHATTPCDPAVVEPCCLIFHAIRE